MKKNQAVLSLSKMKSTGDSSYYKNYPGVTKTLLDKYKPIHLQAKTGQKKKAMKANGEIIAS